MTIIPFLERRVIFNLVYSEYATEEDALQRGEAANPRGTSMKLLHVDSSILGQHSASRELGAAIVARWQRDVRGIEVEYRDLAANPLPHLSGASLAQADADEAATAAAVMDEFLSADVIVVGAPMYNFGIPSQLKAWIDRVAVAGKTFRYTADGPQGLAGGKQVIVAATYGGKHPVESGRNFVEPYLRQVFAFLGIDDVEFVSADGLSVSPEQRVTSISAARARIDVALPLAA